MRAHLKYFASIREAMGCASETIETSAITLAQLRESLAQREGPPAEALHRSKVVRMALNQHMAEETSKLVEGCEVAFFPPVTGG